MFSDNSVSRSFALLSTFFNPFCASTHLRLSASLAPSTSLILKKREKIKFYFVVYSKDLLWQQQRPIEGLHSQGMLFVTEPLTI